MWFPGLDDYITRWVGRALRRRGHPSAELIARCYARLRPRHGSAKALASSVLLLSDRNEEAEAHLMRFRETHRPTDPRVGWNLAEALIRQDRFNDARRMLQDEVAAFPNSPLPFLALAKVASLEGERDEAIRLAGEAENRAEATDHATQYALAGLLARYPHTLAKAEALARAAADDLQYDAEVQLFVGELLASRGNPESEVYLERARRRWNGQEPLESTRKAYRDLLRGAQEERSAEPES
jgi:Flp pilus assembly protein TadD